MMDDMLNKNPRIQCNQCDAHWAVTATFDGKGYDRDSLVEIAPRVAAHMRDAHQDEDAAIRFEKWAVTTPPWSTSD